MRPILRLALSALSAALSLGAAEAFARWRWPVPPPLPGARLADGLSAECATTHPTLGWAYRAGRCGRDAHGLQRFPWPAPDGARSLLLIGDSVGEKEWSAHLADALRAATGVPVEVLNGAVTGYHLCQEAEALRLRLAELRPDAVVLQSCPNDLVGSVTTLPAGPHTALVQTARGWWTVPRALLRYRLPQVALVAAGMRAPTSGGGSIGPAGPRCAQQMAEDLARTGIPGVVLHFPALVAADDPSPEARQLLGNEAGVRAVWAETPLPRVDGRPALEAVVALPELSGGRGDLLHPKPGTGALVAAALAGPLAEGLGW